MRAQRPLEDVMHYHAHKAQHGTDQSNRLKDVFPNGETERNARLGRQVAIVLRLGDVVQNINDVRAANRVGVVDTRVFESRHIAQLRGPLFGQELHIVLGAKVQAARRTRLDAGGFQASSYSVRAQGTLVNLLGVGIELRNIERTTGDTELAADTVFLLKIDDAVLVLHDGAVGRTGPQAARIGAVHALMLAHQPGKAAVGVLIFVELDQVPVIPVGVGHGLVGIVEVGLLERHIVPLHASYLTGLATDAGGGVNQLANLVLALCTRARDRSGMGRDLLDS